ncbi:MAG TPA: hypothetical protein VJ783_02225 [Pirellulales bacterium]|nr:hypothetical protein [Pirellulales bacterium]
MSEIERLTARQTIEYAAACLTREALLLAQQMDVAMLSAETLTGGNRSFQHLQRQVRGMFGATAAAKSNPQEQAAVADVEREIAAQFPFYGDHRRLNEVHDAIGLMRLRG